MNRHNRPLIALVFPNLRGGGVERMSLRLATEFMERGYAVDFVVREAQGDLRDLLPEGSGLVDLSARRVRHAFFPLLRYFRRARPQAVLVAMWPLTTLALIAWRLSGARGQIATSDHSPLSVAYRHKSAWHRRFLHWSLRLVYPLADTRIAVSRGVAQDLAELSGLPLSGIKVIYNLATPEQQPVEDEPVLSGAWISGGGKRLLAVGNLKTAKNYPMMLHAFALLLENTEAQLMILGEGPLRDELQALAEQLNITGRVTFAGFVLDTAAYYRSADLFLLSSDYEGFGNVLVEAMSHGVPVVSTDCPGGPAEVLDQGRYGALAASGDPQAFAQAIRETLQAPPRANDLIRRSQDFGPETIAGHYLEALFPTT